MPKAAYARVDVDSPVAHIVEDREKKLRSNWNPGGAVPRSESKSEEKSTDADEAKPQPEKSDAAEASDISKESSDSTDGLVKIPILELPENARLAQDVVTSRGQMMLPKGERLSERDLIRLESLLDIEAVPDEIFIFGPDSPDY